MGLRLRVGSSGSNQCQSSLAPHRPNIPTNLLSNNLLSNNLLSNNLLSNNLLSNNLLSNNLLSNNLLSNNLLSNNLLSNNLLSNNLLSNNLLSNELITASNAVGNLVARVYLSGQRVYFYRTGRRMGVVLFAEYDYGQSANDGGVGPLRC